MRYQSIKFFYNRAISLILILVLFSFSGFSQNTLDYYLKAAHSNNPGVKENQAQSEKSSIQKDIIQAEYLGPKISVNAEINDSPLFPARTNPLATGYDAAITNGGLYAALLNVHQPVFNKSRSAVFNKQATLSGESGLNKAKLNLHQLDKEVTDQYITAYQSLNQIDFVTRVRDQLQQQKEIVQTLASRGIYKRSDILLIDIQIQQQNTELSNLNAIYLRNVFKLNDLCGIYAPVPATLTDPQLDIKPNVSQSQFLEQFRLDSLTQVTDLQVSDLKYKPQFNLYGNTGLLAIQLDGIQRKFGFALGVTMAVPLYDGNQKKYTHQQTAVNLRTIDSYKQNFQTQRANRQQAILSALNMIEQKNTQIRAQLKNFELLLDIYKVEMNSGNLPIIDYMNTIKSYTDAKNSLTMSETEKLLIISENNYYNW